MRMKRENSTGECDGPARKLNRSDECIRLLIPSKIAGAIIGKGGQNIQKLRSQYKATVTVDDCQGPERTILISSDLEAVCGIVMEIIKSFEEKEGEIDLRLLIHQSLAGCVIGKAGSKIKELREKIGSRIKIFSNVAPQSTDRVVQILGNPDHCIDSIKEIVSIVKPTPIRGPVHNYDPINYDDVYADDYGGFGSSGGGGGGNGRVGSRGGDRGRDRRDLSRGSNGRSSNRDRDMPDPWARPPLSMQHQASQNQGTISFLANNGPLGVVGGGSQNNGNNTNNSSMNGNGVAENGANKLINSNSNGFATASGGGGGANPGAAGPIASILSVTSTGGSNGSTNGDPSISKTQVTIPKDLAGAIIGKGGGRIRRIRSESNAFITIDEPLQGSNDRIITITGNPKQIQTAQYLLQQSVHENRRKF